MMHPPFRRYFICLLISGIVCGLGGCQSPNRSLQIPATLSLADDNPYRNLPTSRLKELARTGDAGAQYAYAAKNCCGAEYTNNQEAFIMLCSAAKQGHFKAQSSLARLYVQGIEASQNTTNGRGFSLKPDLERAFMWYTILAKRSHDAAIIQERNSLKKRLTHEEINAGFRLLKNWQAYHCNHSK